MERPRPGGGGGVGTVFSCLDFAREIQKFKNFFGLRPNDKGGPLPRNGRFAAEGRFIQCKFGPTARGGVQQLAGVWAWPGPYFTNALGAGLWAHIPALGEFLFHEQKSQQPATSNRNQRPATV